jgi:hypothetical protein
MYHAEVLLFMDIRYHKFFYASNQDKKGRGIHDGTLSGIPGIYEKDL